MREHGFTLLELLISVAMLSMIIVIILGAAQLGYRTIETGEKKIDSLERLRTSMSLISSQVQSQIPLTYDDEGEQKVYFKGSNDSLQFTTGYSLWGSNRGQVFVHYTVETDNNGKRFLKATEHLTALGREAGTRLFDNLDACSFSYFYKDPLEESGNWTEEWTDTLHVPHKVRLTFSYQQKDFSTIIPVRAYEPRQPAAQGIQTQPKTGTERPKPFLGPS